MGTTNRESGTNIHEVADGLYRINTPVQIAGGPGAFSFNQYLTLTGSDILESLRKGLDYFACENYPRDGGEIGVGSPYNFGVHARQRMDRRRFTSVDSTG